MLIRSIRLEDAEQFLLLRKQIAGETFFMRRSPEEITTTNEQQLAHIQALLTHNYHLLLVAEQQPHLVGYLLGIRGEIQRTSHCLIIVIGIAHAFCHQGIGTHLFSTMEQWAKQNDILRLELHVLMNNVAALGLYQKQGFSIEGTMRAAQRIYGTSFDEYLMAKLL